LRFAVGIPNVREYGDPRLLVSLALDAERAGWDGVFLWDHLVYHDRRDLVADPWIAISAIGAVTSRVRVGVLVVALSRRRPWKVAREAASLDVLTDGRAVFGVGLGSLGEGEWTAFGEEASDRVRAEKLDEGLEIVTGLWRGEPFTYDGRHYRVAETVFVPPPRQRPRIPVWVGGRWPSKRPFRRAARWDGVFPTHRGVEGAKNMDPAELAKIVSFTKRHRPPDAGPLDVIVEVASTGRDRRADEALVQTYADAGLTWWIEKVGWFRGSLDDARSRIRAGPPA
jgi:alkanesulfonate monooxygenase SsuD/methylene tetrahydromethanopterin reductase-like flavin-dependent oxidoreductase (luciferase family)